MMIAKLLHVLGKTTISTNAKIPAKRHRLFCCFLKPDWLSGGWIQAACFGWEADGFDSACLDTPVTNGPGHRPVQTWNGR